jgi:hypothetical protein
LAWASWTGEAQAWQAEQERKGSGGKTELPEKVATSDCVHGDSEILQILKVKHKESSSFESSRDLCRRRRGFRVNIKRGKRVKNSELVKNFTMTLAGRIIEW